MENVIKEKFDPLEVLEKDPRTREYLRKKEKSDVEQIIRSYHQTYDHLQEALQNAVDACESAFHKYLEGKSSKGSKPYRPQIVVTVDLHQNAITVLDNGIGMTAEHIRKYFFSPHVTLKKELTPARARARGEKGVGATFLAYGSASLHVSSKDIDTSEISSCKMDKGIEWVLAEDPSLESPRACPVSPPDSIQEIPHGTIITIGFSDNTNLKNLRRHGTEIEHWEKILRLFTATGYISPLEEDDPFFKVLNVTLEIIDEGGRKNTRSIRTGYLYPHLVEEVNKLRLSNIQREREGRLPARQRMKDCLWEFYSREQIRERISELESTEVDRHEISRALAKYHPRVYVALVWSREFWKNLNQRCFRSRRMEFNHGLAFSTITQRVGEQLPLTFRWRSGDYNRFFVLLDVKNLHADIGRKSVPQDLKNLGNEIANMLQKHFIDNQDALRPTPRRREVPEEVRLEKLIDEVLSPEYGDLIGSKPLDLKILKVPHEEQDVIALFFYLLGKGYLKGYKVLATTMSAIYDGIAQFSLTKSDDVLYKPTQNPLGIPLEKFRKAGGEIRSPQRSLIEFKFSSDGLIRDVVRGDKQLSDIRWLVCWKIGKMHTREGFEILDITSEDQKGYRDYYGVTHLLVSREAEVQIICLEKVLQILVNLQRKKL